MPSSVMAEDRLRSVPPPPAGGEVAPTTPPQGLMLVAPLRYGLGTRAEVEAELDGIVMAVRMFAAKQPDQVMRETAAYAARLSELAMLLHRVESSDRQYLRLRTMQVAVIAAEMQFQFKVASRLVEVMRQDIALLGGQP